MAGAHLAYNAKTTVHIEIVYNMVVCVSLALLSLYVQEACQTLTSN